MEEMSDEFKVGDTIVRMLVGFHSLRISGVSSRYYLVEGIDENDGTWWETKMDKVYMHNNYVKVE